MKLLMLLASVLPMAACSTMRESLQLGAGVGAAVGAAATYTGHSAAGSPPSIETLTLGTGIGLGLGLITSYFTHKGFEQDRSDGQAYETEIYFGDLPPSPFIMPQSDLKRGRK
ncbi:MAG: hypothetical protein K2X47_08440 [Bdellovibrionales bacterium]|nr:hypothetical protein [Bdellovibrionales bacterium]